MYTYSRSYATVQLVKKHMRGIPIMDLIARTGEGKRHNSEDIDIITMYRGCNQKSPAWIKTQCGQWAWMSSKL